MVLELRRQQIIAPAHVNADGVRCADALEPSCVGRVRRGLISQLLTDVAGHISEIALALPITDKIGLRATGEKTRVEVEAALGKAREPSLARLAIVRARHAARNIRCAIEPSGLFRRGKPHRGAPRSMRIS